MKEIIEVAQVVSAPADAAVKIETADKLGNSGVFLPAYEIVGRRRRLIRSKLIGY